MVQVHPQHQRVMGIEAPLQRPAQLRDLGSHPGACQLGKGVEVADAGDERFEHLPGRHPEDVGDHRVQLDPGVLEQLLDPLGLPGAFLDQLLAVAGQVAQLGDHRWRHEAGPQQPALAQLGQPLRVADIGLAARQVLHRVRVGQQQLPSRDRVEDMPDRFPEHPGGLHRDLSDTLGDQPVAQLAQRRGERPEPAHRRPSAPGGTRGSYARHHGVLVHVQARAPGNDHIHC